MTSRSARIASERPFYELHADTYDALITDPVEPWVDLVDEQLRSAGLSPAAVLDAGCGTGRHAATLIGRGHRVTLLDASEALLRIAGRRCPCSPTLLTDLCAPATNDTFDAVLARGVLNDLLSEQERTDALASFARLTRSGGILALDVREAEVAAACGRELANHRSRDGERLPSAVFDPPQLEGGADPRGGTLRAGLLRWAADGD